MHNEGAHMPQHVCGGQRTTLWSRFSPSTWTWVSGCHTYNVKCPYPLNQFTNLSICFTRQGLSLKLYFSNLVRLANELQDLPVPAIPNAGIHACAAIYTALGWHLWNSSILQCISTRHALFHCTGHYTPVTHSSGRGHLKLWYCYYLCIFPIF